MIVGRTMHAAISRALMYGTPLSSFCAAIVGNGVPYSLTLWYHYRPVAYLMEIAARVCLRRINRVGLMLHDT